MSAGGMVRSFWCVFRSGMFGRVTDGRLCRYLVLHEWVDAQGRPSRAAPSAVLACATADAGNVVIRAISLKPPLVDVFSRRMRFGICGIRMRNVGYTASLQQEARGRRTVLASIATYGIRMHPCFPISHRCSQPVRLVLLSSFHQR